MAMQLNQLIKSQQAGKGSAKQGSESNGQTNGNHTVGAQEVEPNREAGPTDGAAQSSDGPTGSSQIGTGNSAGGSPKKNGLAGLRLGGRPQQAKPAAKPSNPGPASTAGDSDGTQLPDLGDSSDGGNAPAGGLSKLSGLKLGTSTARPPAMPSVGSLDSLADIAADESSGLVPERPEFEFPDEVPADAPDRELPEDMTEAMQGFVKSLDGIYSVASDPELFGQMIRSIMQELQENPQYAKLIHDDDVATMIRGMRESMGMARIKKEANKSKRAGGSTTTKKARTQKNDDMLDDLAALAAGLGGLD